MGDIPLQACNVRRQCLLLSYVMEAGPCCMFVKLFLNFRIEDKFKQVHADESVQEKIASAPQLTRLMSYMVQILCKFQIYSPSNKP